MQTQIHPLITTAALLNLIAIPGNPNLTFLFTHRYLYCKFHYMNIIKVLYTRADVR